jgi:hypothetical protein
MSRKRKHKIVMALANPERVRRDQERRRSGAAGAHKSKWDESRRKIRQQMREMRKCDICEG